MRLYVAGETEKTRHAIDNLKGICDIYLKDRSHIEVIDLRKHPEIAARKEVYAIPTLARELPPPTRKVIGDLHVTEKVLPGLDIEKKDRNVTNYSTYLPVRRLLAKCYIKIFYR